MKRQLTIVCICYTVFVIYGSLVPWHFNGLSINEALDRFQTIPYLELGMASRADWVANILLFIPLAFFGMARLSWQQQSSRKLFATVFVLAGSVFLCFAIEFTQLFFPPRTVSLNDLIAETLGAIIGIMVYWFLGGTFIQWLETWQAKQSDSSFYLQSYLVILFLYNVLPLDLTLSPVEFYHKWREGRIILLPFSGFKGDIFQDIYDTMADIALWVPVPWLWLKKLRLSSGQLLVRVFASASIIELFQLFVYSRVTDVTDVLLAVIGAGIGVILLGFYGNGSAEQGRGIGLKSAKGSFLKLCIVYVLWGMVIVAVFWYPYDFQLNNGHFSIWTERFFKVPFHAYYYGTEFRAITEVFHKILFFIPLGVVSGLMVIQIKSQSKSLMLASIMVAIFALLVEFGQLFLPNKNADITDLILEVLGGYLGFMLIQKIYHVRERNVEISRHRVSSSVTLQTQVNSQTITAGNIQNFGRLFGLVNGFVVFTTLAFVSQNQSVPYNLRELFSSQYPVLSALGITLLLYWCFSYPLLFLLNMLSKNVKQSLFCIKFVMIHGLGAWLMVRFIIPIESIHDIIGSPILPVPGELEMAFRFMALFAVYSLIIMGASYCALLSVIDDREFRRLFFLGGIFYILVLPICYWIVVVSAATDNLTELMVNGGYSFFVINILLYFFLFSWLGSFAVLSVVFRKIKNIFIFLIISAISFPLGYQLVCWGTESVILKYNAIFSAMQFLLSSDRQNLLSEDVLRVRFFVLHLGFILITIFTQFPMVMIYYNAIKKYQNKRI